MKNTRGSSNSESSEVTVMLYPVIIPFLSDEAGRSQVRVKLLENTSTAEKFRGGPLGTVQKYTYYLVLIFFPQKLTIF